MQNLDGRITAFKNHVREASSNPAFLHHKWFVKWHLEIVERIATELLAYYPHADKKLVELMVWLHDYGKILDYDDQYQKTLTAGRTKLAELGLDADYIERAISNIKLMDRKLEVDLHEAPIEVQIVASADGCSHMVGPFMHVFWHEATDRTFAGRTYEQLMEANLKKLEKDWNRKITLPEARRAFEPRYSALREQSGQLPENFLS